jgi:hypothetical protein
MEVNINWNKFDSKLYSDLPNMDIPDFNPGTLSYDDFWDEQDKRCLEGYKPRSFMPKITGRHYFYLNMCRINLLKKGAKRKTLDYPFYRELDRRLYDELEDAIKHRHGLIVGKPRRVGLSYFGASASLYELLFFILNKIGVAAGQDDKAQDFYEKVKGLMEDLRPEYTAAVSIKNDDVYRLSYFDIENKQKKEYGLKSTMYMKTMYANPSGFEGKELSLVIFEEAGLFDDIIAAFKATEPCFKEGAIQYGIPIIYGTGGDIEKGSKGYQTLWRAKKETYNLKKIFVSATDYYPGDGIPDEKTGKTVSFFDRRTGKTNSEAALKYIMAERQQKEGSEGYIKHLQTYPLKESDIFIKNSGGFLNRKKLNAQKNRLDDCPYPILTGRLEWTTKDPVTMKLIARAKNLKEIDKIHLSRGSKITFIEDDELGTVKKLMDPIDHKRLPFNPDILGCDSYDDEVKEGTGSLGATIVYRCFYSVNRDHDLPIAYVMDRGTSDEDDEFYSASLRLCVYYDAEMLLEYTKILIKSYFEGAGGMQYLKARPNLEGQGYNSNAVNQVGFKLSNQYAFGLTLRLLKAEVNQNFDKIWFEEILDHLIDFGESNADLGSAYGMCMVSKLDMFGDLSEGIEDEPDNNSIIDNFGGWVNEGGSKVWKTEKQVDLDNDPYAFDKKANIFDPEFDLAGEEREDFENLKISSRDRMKKEQQDIVDLYGGDVFAFTLEEHHRKLNKN